MAGLGGGPVTRPQIWSPMELICCVELSGEQSRASSADHMAKEIEVREIN